MKRIIYCILFIAILTILNFWWDDIYYYYQVTTIKYHYQDETANSYSLDYKFSYLSNYNEAYLTKRDDLVNSIYTLLNNGSKKITRYCRKEYQECNNDIKEIAKNEELLSYINSFIHPYNSFNTISFIYDNRMKVEIETENIYNENEIKQIENKVNEIIKNNIKDSMSDQEKIKTIHDYIINHTKYDLLKKDNINDPTYHSNTAYGVLFEGYGICSGYSDTMTIFLNKFKIPNYKISNDTHIWNLVYINNQWLHIDLTWDDPISSNNQDNIDDKYFLIDSNTLYKLDSSKEHYFNKQIYQEAIKTK